MSGYRDDLRAAHQRIASLQREADDLRKRAKDEAQAASTRIEQLETQVAMLERDDAQRALRERIESVEEQAADRHARDQRELEAATMKILALEETVHQHTKDYDRTFARIGQLEAQLAKANQNQGELDAATMKILALEEAAREKGDPALEVVRAELDAVRAELGEAKWELVGVRRELEEKVDALSRKDEEVDRLRARLDSQSVAVSDAERRVRVSRVSSPLVRSTAEPEQESEAIQRIRQIDDDLARLSPAGNWELVYRMPKAIRARRRQGLASIGFVVVVMGLLVAAQGPSAFGTAALIAGALAVVISMIAGPSVHRGTVEHVRKDPNDGRYLLARIDGSDLLLPREAESAIVAGKQAVVERGSLGEGTLVVLTPADRQSS